MNYPIIGYKVKVYQNFSPIIIFLESIKKLFQSMFGHDIFLAKCHFKIKQK